MEAIKAKTPVSDLARQQIIDSFMGKIKDYKDHLSRFQPSCKIILFIASTSDTVNKNGRIIDGDFVDSNLENFIGIPVKYDHSDSQKAILGNVFYASSCIDEVNKCKYTVLAAVVDNIKDMTKAQLSEYSRLNFSVGYQSFGSDAKCDKCNRETEAFLNIYSKKMECEHCDGVLNRKYNCDNLKVKAHARVFKRDTAGKYIRYSWDDSDLMMSHMPEIKKKSKKDSDLYFMVIQNHKINEVSFVDTPADALDAPLIAFTDVGVALSTLSPTDSVFYNSRLNKIDYITDNNLNDSIDINLYTNNGESHKMNDFICDLMVSLYSKDEAPKDLVLKDYFKDKESVASLKEELTDTLAIKYINAYVAKVQEAEKSASDQVKVLSDELESIKKDLADKEAKLAELEKAANPTDTTVVPPATDPANDNVSPADNTVVLVKPTNQDNNGATTLKRRATT